MTAVLRVARVARVAAIAAVAVAGGDALAGGMMLPVRGVRTVERAGALIAGADDADALWLDPAGLAHLAGDGHRQLLFDAAYAYQTVDYARLDASGAKPPTVSNQQPGEALPALAGALGIGDRLVIAGGIAAPYIGLARYDQAGAQRYGSVSTQGSQFIYVTVGAAYKLSDQLRLGATVTDVFSKIDLQTVVSVCAPGETCTEAADHDALLTQNQTDYVSLTGSVGAQYDAASNATLGLAVQGPAKLAATGDFSLQLPAAGQFIGATVTGNQAELSLTLPAAIRAGVEVRPIASLRVEAAVDIELWSMQDAIRIAPQGVQIMTASGMSLPLGEMSIPRRYNNSYAPSIGVEWHGPGFMLGAGYSYETAAAPPGYVSVLTVDSAKQMVGFGGGYEAEGWQIGAAVGYVALADVNVALADAKVPQLTPLRSPTFSADAINAGSYQSRYLIAGLRFARQF